MADDPHASHELHVSRGMTDDAYKYASSASGGAPPASRKDEDEEEEGPKRPWYQPAPCPWSAGAFLRIGFVLVIIGALIAAFIERERVAEFAKPPDKDGKGGGWLYEKIGALGVWGPVVYALLYMVATVCMVPGSFLTLLAGALFLQWGSLPGLFIGFATVSVGSTAGCALAFLLGRTVLYNWVQSKVQSVKVFRAIDIAVSKRGFVMVILLRLVPLLPFNLLNYMLALTSTSFVSYVGGSWLGMIPGTFLYVYLGWAVVAAIGNSSGSGDKSAQNLRYGLYGVGAVAAIVVFAVVIYFARKEMKKAMDEEEEENDDVESGSGSVNRTDDPERPLLA